MSKKFVSLRIKKVIRETPEAVSIHFEKPADGSFDYLPGQYLTLKLKVGEEELRRAYSLCSSPFTDEDLVVAVKAVAGGKVSSWLNDNIEKTPSLEVFPPMGKFTIQVDAATAKHYVLIGGGSGITPLFSMLKSVLEKEPKSKVTLIYANRSQAATVFRDALQALEKSHPERLRILHCLAEPEAGWQGMTGMLNRNSLMPIFQSLLSSDSLPKSFYMCGPAGLMEEAKHALDFLGISKKDIHQELFTAPIPHEDEAPKSNVVSPELKRDTYKVKVILDDKETTITVKPQQSILDVAIQEGLDPPFACQLGICTTCRAKVHSGAVEMDETEGLTDAEIEDGYILTCQAHPLSPDCVVEYG